MGVARSIAPNLLEWQSEATAPNQRWVAGFTYIGTGQGWRYFAVVHDLFSRRVVCWSASSQMTSQLLTDALVMALWRRGRPQGIARAVYEAGRTRDRHYRRAAYALLSALHAINRRPLRNSLFQFDGLM